MSSDFSRCCCRGSERLRPAALPNGADQEHRRGREARSAAREPRARAIWARIGTRVSSLAEGVDKLLTSPQNRLRRGSDTLGNDIPGLGTMGSLAPKTNYEKYCMECGAVIRNAEICPVCGVRQAAGPKPRSTGSKVLIGCLIAAGVFVLGIPAIGVIAAIAIPKFANTKEKAYMAAMKSDLRNLVTAEEAFFKDSVRYTANTSRLTFRPSTGVSTPAIAVGNGYWSGTVTHSEVPGRVCAIAVNTSNTLDPKAGDGEPVCR